MTLSALIDAGASVEQIETAICSLGLPDLQLRTEQVKKFGFAAQSPILLRERQPQQAPVDLADYTCHSGPNPEAENSAESPPVAQKSARETQFLPKPIATDAILAGGSPSESPTLTKVHQVTIAQGR